MLRWLGATIAVLQLVLVPVAKADFGNVDPGQPIYVSANSNTVAYYNETGGMRSTTNIPGGSQFKLQPASPCSFVATATGATLDGTPFVAGQTVTSTRYLWVEFDGLPTTEAPGPTGPITTTLGTLGQARRLFGRFCEVPHGAAFLGSAWVTANDPFLDPRPTARNLLTNLQLIEPAVYTNDVVDVWGGLVTRYPAWLAIQPEAWQPQRSSVAHHRGWTIYLHTTPARMEFEVTFTPDPTKPSAPFHGVVACVSAPADADMTAAAFPPLPALPEQTEPGVNGACMWTPSGPGTVTIQARITYSVTMWVNGYTEAMPDYTWVSPPATFETVELAAVNTKGP